MYGYIMKESDRADKTRFPFKLDEYIVPKVSRIHYFAVAYCSPELCMRELRSLIIELKSATVSYRMEHCRGIIPAKTTLVNIAAHNHTGRWSISWSK